jgi:DNA polymerase V
MRRLIVAGLESELTLWRQQLNPVPVLQAPDADETGTLSDVSLSVVACAQACVAGLRFSGPAGV